ncbi:unnamed protein product, partial [Ceratitis capitata]
SQYAEAKKYIVDFLEELLLKIYEAGEHGTQWNDLLTDRRTGQEHKRYIRTYLLN